MRDQVIEGLCDSRIQTNLYEDERVREKGKLCREHMNSK